MAYEIKFGLKSYSLIDNSPPEGKRAGIALFLPHNANGANGKGLNLYDIIDKLTLENYETLQSIANIRIPTSKNDIVLVVYTLRGAIVCGNGHAWKVEGATLEEVVESYNNNKANFLK